MKNFERVHFQNHFEEDPHMSYSNENLPQNDIKNALPHVLSKDKNFFLKMISRRNCSLLLSKIYVFVHIKYFFQNNLNIYKILFANNYRKHCDTYRKCNYICHKPMWLQGTREIKTKMLDRGIKNLLSLTTCECICTLEMTCTRALLYGFS